MSAKAVLAFMPPKAASQVPCPLDPYSYILAIQPLSLVVLV